MKGSAMRKGTKLSIGIAGAAVVFMAGWGASDILMVKRLVVMDAATDETRVIIGTDPMGGGYIIVKDFQGNEVFSVRGKKVNMPSGTAAAGASSPTGPTTPSVGRVVQLLRIETMEVDPAVWDRIDTLRAEAAALESGARSAEAREAYLSDLDKDQGKNDIDNQKQRARLREKAADMRKKAKRNNGEASRLERDAETTKQRVYCWDGTTDVILETRRDLSIQLNKIPARGFLSWRGIRKSLDGGFEVFEVSSIKAAQRPRGFVGK